MPCLTLIVEATELHNLFLGSSYQCIQLDTSIRTPEEKFHSYFSVKTYICEICSKRFCEKWLLSRHLRVHTGERPFKCTLCNYSAGQSFNLKRHMAMKHN